MTFFPPGKPGQIVAVHKVNPSTVARIAGNIAAGMMGKFDERAEVHGYEMAVKQIADEAVDLANAIVAEVERRTPAEKA